jgi:dephospho-CoA kinase
MRIDEEREKDIPSVVVDAAIIIEADWLSVVDELWVVISDLDNILERLKLRDGLSREAIMARISTQLAQEERMKYATLTIENNSDLPSLKNKVESLWRNRIMQK